MKEYLIKTKSQATESLLTALILRLGNCYAAEWLKATGFRKMLYMLKSHPLVN